MIETLNHKHIFYFWVVAKRGSIMKASSELNVSQSSVSEQIRLLEESLGVQLFYRSKKGVSTTEYGKRIFAIVDEFFPKLDELAESLLNHKSADVRFLNIGLAPTLSSQVRYAFSYPFIEDIHFTVKIHWGENSYLRQAFEQREIDIILTANESLSPNISSEKRLLGNKKIVFVVRKSFAKGKSSLKDLDGYKFINYTTDADQHYQLRDYLKSKNLRPIRIAEIDDILLVKSVVLSMDCFAAIPYKVVEKEVDEGSLVVIDTPPIKFQPTLRVFYRKELVSERFNNLLSQAEQGLAELFS